MADDFNLHRDDRRKKKFDTNHDRGGRGRGTGSNRGGGGRGDSERGARSQVARETLDILEKGRYSVDDGKTVVSGIDLMLKKALDGTQLYTPTSLQRTIIEETSRPVDYQSRQEEEEEESSPSSFSSSSSSPPSSLSSSLPFIKTKIRVIFSTTLEVAQRLAAAERSTHPKRTHTRIGVLNFASAKNPGGGFLSGAVAQEEVIARSSGLYPCLTSFTSRLYYSDNKATVKTGLYTNNMIWSPDVPVFRNDDCDLLKTPYPIGVITAPAVNAGIARQRLSSSSSRGGSRGRNGNSRGQPPSSFGGPSLIEDQILSTMRTRIEGVLAIAKRHGCETLVLGAWGCGVFRNDPASIALLFFEVLSGNLGVVDGVPSFKSVYFVINQRDKYEIFKHVLDPEGERKNKEDEEDAALFAGMGTGEGEEDEEE